MKSKNRYCHDSNDIFSAFIYIKSGVKNPKIIFEDNEFIMHIRQSGSTRWRCSYCNKTKCKSRLYTTGQSLYIMKSHNHEPNSKDGHDALLSKIVNVFRHNSYYVPQFFILFIIVSLQFFSFMLIMFHKYMLPKKLQRLYQHFVHLWQVTLDPSLFQTVEVNRNLDFVKS